jgi:hypothetical protein
MDHHVPRAITAGLRARGVDILTAYEDGAHQLEDSTLLDRAAELKRVLFTRDEDFLIEATRRQELGIPFYGIVYAHQLRVSVGRCIEDLEIIAMVGEETDLLNEVKYLPL